MKKVYIINGEPRSGKDSFVEAYQTALKELDIDKKVYNMSYVGEIKDFVKIVVGEDLPKDADYRALIESIGYAFKDYRLAKQRKDILAMRLVDKINAIDDNNAVFFICCRDCTVFPFFFLIKNAFVSTIFMKGGMSENYEGKVEADWVYENQYPYNFSIENKFSYNVNDVKKQLVELAKQLIKQEGEETNE